MTPHSIVPPLPLIGWKLLATAKGAFDVTMIDTEGPDSTEVEVILAWTHTWTFTWPWPWTIWADAWAS